MWFIVFLYVILGMWLLLPHKQTYDIYVINLEKRTDRLKAFLEEYKKTELKDPIIFKAHTGDNLDDIDPDIRNEILEAEKSGKRKFHASLTRGAIGCFRSHLGIYKQLKSDIGVIFEDDTTFKTQANIEDILKDAPKTWDVLILQGICHQCTDHDKNWMSVKNFWCTHAYLIKKCVAKRLINSPIRKQFDKFLADQNLEIFMLRDSFVSGQNASMSDIQTTDVEDKNIY